MPAEAINTMAAIAAADTAETSQQIEITELATHPNHKRLVRLFYLNPVPGRLLVLVGCGDDKGVVCVAAAPSTYDGIADGSYGWADPCVSGGFIFSKAILLTLTDEEGRNDDQPTDYSTT